LEKRHFASCVCLCLRFQNEKEKAHLAATALITLPGERVSVAFLTVQVFRVLENSRQLPSYSQKGINRLESIDKESIDLRIPRCPTDISVLHPEPCTHTILVVSRVVLRVMAHPVWIAIRCPRGASRCIVRHVERREERRQSRLVLALVPVAVAVRGLLRFSRPVCHRYLIQGPGLTQETTAFDCAKVLLCT
jgi:hypothetical protein